MPDMQTLVAFAVMSFVLIVVPGSSVLFVIGRSLALGRRGGLMSVLGNGPSSWSVLREGFIVGVTNPKTIVFFVAVLPQFVTPQNGSVAVQMAVLGLVFTVIAFACDACWALVASATRQWFATSPQRLSTMRATGGGMLVGMGATLALAPPRADWRARKA